MSNFEANFNVGAAGKVFDIIFGKRGATVSSIVNLTGLSKGTVIKILDEYRERGIFVSRLSNDRNRGRRPRIYSLSKRPAVAVIDLTGGKLYVTVSDFYGEKKTVLVDRLETVTEDELLDYLKILSEKFAKTITRKTVASAVYIVDGRYDPYKDILVSHTQPVLSKFRFSEYKYPGVPCYVTSREGLKKACGAMGDGERALFIKIADGDMSASVISESGELVSYLDLNSKEGCIIAPAEGEGKEGFCDRIIRVAELFDTMLKLDRVYIEMPHPEPLTSSYITERLPVSLAERTIFADGAAADMEKLAIKCAALGILRDMTAITERK